MESPDVNVLIYAFDESAPCHAEYLAWLDARVNGTESFALAEPVWSGFLRITTNQRLFQKPVSLERSLAFVERLCPADDIGRSFSGSAAKRTQWQTTFPTRTWLLSQLKPIANGSRPMADSPDSKD
jgi:predicted nucleic acid-binding protein